MNLVRKPTALDHVIAAAQDKQVGVARQHLAQHLAQVWICLENSLGFSCFFAGQSCKSHRRWIAHAFQEDPRLH